MLNIEYGSYQKLYDKYGGKILYMILIYILIIHMMKNGLHRIWQEKIIKI